VTFHRLKTNQQNILEFVITIKLKPNVMKTLIVTAILLAGATVGRSQESKVVFIRTGPPLSVPYSVIINNEFKGKVKANNHLSLTAGDGSLLIQVRRAGRKQSEFRETIIASPAPGKTHYFMIIESNPGLDVVEMTELSGLRMLTKQEVWRSRNSNKLAKVEP
jgi:hypothetical protein